ncbi:hypothetical protein PHLCEN_2v6538 [Hermanssonia centrifuga]|uniref:Transferase n=1 Tax=Hermanssonia centrifuga TaxID=98765 RepID=A0A2R6NZ46_9APHY|nr:hypothetical protein PHLCEN_2v6538 [Hermanssonia centrifuga]
MADIPTPTLNVFAVSRKRIFPTSQQPSGLVRTTPLSILDESVLRFAPSACVWIFSTPTLAREKMALSHAHLENTLSQTLGSYPQWAGQLHWSSSKTVEAHGVRPFGRLAVTYGSVTDDPGVEFVAATCPHSLNSLLPSSTPGSRTGTHWRNATSFPTTELLPSTPLALNNLKDYLGLPSMIVQITDFACGSVGVAVKLAHPLADAQALAHFVHDWAKLSRACMSDPISPPPLPVNPVFEPSKLETAIGGPSSLTGPHPLPMHHYDWWASESGCPEFMKGATRPPTDSEVEGTYGTPIPWTEWDPTAPVSHYVLHFDRDGVQRLWEEAISSLSISRTNGVDGRLSRMDVVLAYVWGLILRARGLETDDGPVHLDVTLGMRTRLSPPLPDSFLGSPIILADVLSSARSACLGSENGLTASTIRSTLEQFGSNAVHALLHRMLTEHSPPWRYWQAFLGERHAIVTSWARLGVYDVDFGAGQRPICVEGVMPNVDGCVQVMEAQPSSRLDSEERKKGSQWYDDGVDVNLYLRTDVLEELVRKL